MSDKIATRFPWLVEGSKPLVRISVALFPFGSLNYWAEVPMEVFRGSVIRWAEDIWVPIYNTYLCPLVGGTYVLFYTDGSVVATPRPSFTDYLCILPYGFKTIIAQPDQPNAMDYFTSITIELLLRPLHEFGYHLSADESLQLRIYNWTDRLEALLLYHGTAIWKNALSAYGHTHKTALNYTPLRFTISMGRRRYSAVKYYRPIAGTAQTVSDTEYCLFITGLSENPVFFSWLGDPVIGSISAGSLWIDAFPRRLPSGGLFWDLSECWMRLFVNIPEIRYLELKESDRPIRSGVWIREHSRYYNANLDWSFQSGSIFLGIIWTLPQLPILSKLILGTTQYFPPTPFTHQAPILHVSYTSELTADSIAASGQVELNPFKLSDWDSYQWIAYPLSRYRVEIPAQGELYVGARVGYSVNVDQNAVRVSISLEDNQALMKRMTVDMPVSYDYWLSSDAARDFLSRFSMGFYKHPAAADIPLLPELYGERKTTFAWRPRLGETALDFFNKIAQLNGWRVDWTHYGSVVALPKWQPVGSVWIALWPSDDLLLRTSDFYVSRLKLNVSDYDRRNILLLYGVDANTQADIIGVWADLEAFVDPTSDRYMPIAVPAFVRFDKPIPLDWLQTLGNWISQRLFVSPFQIEFVSPLFINIRPGDVIKFLNPNPMKFHRYDFVVMRVQHEIGREYSTVVSAIAYQQREG
jgi:hypothetical protein